ncbi:MAG TPA: aminotransferase class I/II-fold pyridoxal phosphate-dependent enzyme, partial [Bacteroidota bacterium]|nr:aminotransferase class I/II-fold pyridoxal phosphate-dependent enzyme [Bacteroidota bacterium]
MTNVFRPEIASLAEYTLPQYSYRIKLNQNENPYELPDDVKKEILERISSVSWSRYPSFTPLRQLDMLASMTGWDADGILAGNGSNELLQLLFLSSLERGRAVVISQPTFTLYKILARSMGANVHEVPMGGGFSFDVDALIRVTNENRAAMLVLCSPNNPTGTSLPRRALQKILDSTQA